MAAGSAHVPTTFTETTTASTSMQCKGMVEHVREVQHDILHIHDTGVVCVRYKSEDCRHRETRHGWHSTSERYVCKACGKKFTHNPGFMGRHHDSDTPDDIVGGKSCMRAIQRFREKTKRLLNQSTAWRWAKYYGSLLRKLSNSVVNRVGCQWSADESHYRSKGNGMWLFGVMNKICDWLS